MRKKKLNIIQDRLLKLKILKKEHNYKIIKSMLQYNNISLGRKNYLNFFLTRTIVSKVRFTRAVNTCLITGSRHSIIHKTNFSRQQNKRYLILNKFDNIRILL